MKKTISLLLAGLMLFGLTACNSNEPAGSDAGTNPGASGAPSSDGSKYLNVMLSTNVSA